MDDTTNTPGVDMPETETPTTEETTTPTEGTTPPAEEEISS